MKISLITIILIAVCSAARAQTDEKQTLVQLNQSVLSLYKSQKYDEAAKTALQAVALNVKIYGAEAWQTAVAYTNLGVIYREKGKLKDSVENLQKAADIYQKMSGSKGGDAVNIFRELAYSQLLAGKKSEAEANYLKSLEISETAFGKESKESFSTVLNVAAFYARAKNFDKADEFYLKAYASALKNFGKKSEQFEQIGDSRVCLFGAEKRADDKEKAFKEAKDKLFGTTTEREEKSQVINGKAISLPRPEYPAKARDQRLSGTAAIKVEIDEQGNVVEAKSICRSDVLGKAAEEAARQAKFSPTTVDGKPKRVTGIIVYNFIL